ncbi:MAG: hypothetical protein IIB69_14220 [Proteobacteria bacterium]|nr:hypothetical protein [Pseudomonadota bacterium]
MKEEIRQILETTYAYNVENDRVIDEILTLFNDTEVKGIFDYLRMKKH